jgi:hypothetical protein
MIIKESFPVSSIKSHVVLSLFNLYISVTRQTIAWGFEVPAVSSIIISARLRLF